MGDFKPNWNALERDAQGPDQIWYEYLIRSNFQAAISAAYDGGPGFRALLAEYLCAALDIVSVGDPRANEHFGNLKYDAEWWADLACPRELEAYVGAGLRAIERRTFAPAAQKRLFVALWEAMPAEDRRKFLSRVDPDGQFVRRMA